jgi:hypothetical protein
MSCGTNWAVVPRTITAWAQVAKQVTTWTVQSCEPGAEPGQLLFNQSAQSGLLVLLEDI